MDLIRKKGGYVSTSTASNANSTVTTSVPWVSSRKGVHHRTTAVTIERNRKHPSRIEKKSSLMSSSISSSGHRGSSNKYMTTDSLRRLAEDTHAHKLAANKDLSSLLPSKTLSSVQPDSSQQAMDSDHKLHQLEEQIRMLEQRKQDLEKTNRELELRQSSFTSNPEEMVGEKEEMIHGSEILVGTKEAVALDKEELFHLYEQPRPEIPQPTAAEMTQPRPASVDLLTGDVMDLPTAASIPSPPQPPMPSQPETFSSATAFISNDIVENSASTVKAPTKPQVMQVLEVATEEAESVGNVSFLDELSTHPLKLKKTNVPRYGSGSKLI